MNDMDADQAAGEDIASVHSIVDTDIVAIFTTYNVTAR